MEELVVIDFIITIIIFVGLELLLLFNSFLLKFISFIILYLAINS